jgi:hypothetical protein
MTLCLSSFWSIAQNDTLKIPPDQVKNIYKGLMLSKMYKQRSDACYSAINKLNKIVQDQNDSLLYSMRKISTLNHDIKKNTEERLKSELKIQKLENRKIPWYKHPILYLALGFGGGIYLMK